MDGEVSKLLLSACHYSHLPMCYNPRIITNLNSLLRAGNPYEEKTYKPGTNFLTPRSSFKRWTETVVGMSKDWTEDQGKESSCSQNALANTSIVDTGSVLSLLYGRFIEIWRQKESASQNNRMTRLLIRNASHEGS